MTSWLVVAGDFTPVGGMDSANHALARYLAGERDVHLVTHRASPDLEEMQRVSVHSVPRPFGRHALGGPFLARAGRRLAKRLKRLGVHLIVNGGNCRVPGAVNWVHYVHAAYTAAPDASILRRAKSAMTHRRDLANEGTAFADARLVICNSMRTRDDIVHHHGLAFQLQDDILGIWGDPTMTGKPAAADLYRRKVSLPIIYALHASKRRKRRIPIGKILRDPNAGVCCGAR